jgi:putative phosphoesterase
LRKSGLSGKVAETLKTRRDTPRSEALSDQKTGVIGLISDTHGLLRPEAVQALQGSDLIIHAGDVGDPRILEELRLLAPVVAVRGNVDTSAWSANLPQTAVAQAGPTLIYVLHDLNTLDINPDAAGIHIVVSGHSHKPVRLERDGVLYINPGSAGPRRFNLPISLARLDLRATPWKIDFVELIP